jgi:hypothetical protein
MVFIFFQNTKREAMEMTTPVVTQRGGSQGEKMDMTTPVVTQKVSLAPRLFDLRSRQIG